MFRPIQRPVAADGGGLYAGKLAHTVEELTVEVILQLGVAVVVRAQRKAGDECVVRVEGDGDGLECDERADHEAGEREEGEGEGDLGDDEAAEESLLSAARRGARAALHGGGQMRSRTAPGGRQTEDEDGGAGNGDRREQDRKIEGDDGLVGNGLGRHNAQDDLQTDIGKGKRDRQRDRREDERFGEGGADETPD